MTVLTKQEACALLLRAGEIPDLIPNPPTAALEAVELCGRLPLTVALAGAMIRENIDRWESWLVPTLKEDHAAELRERSVEEAAGGGGDASSIEDRIIAASLRCIKEEERRGVDALFAYVPTERTRCPGTSTARPDRLRRAFGAVNAQVHCLHR